MVTPHFSTFSFDLSPSFLNWSHPLCLSLSVSLSLLSLSVCLFLSLSISFCLSLSLSTLIVCLSLSLSVYLFLSLSLSTLTVCLSLSLSVSLSLSLLFFLCHLRADISPYHCTGYGTILFLQAMMSFEQVRSLLQINHKSTFHNV